MCCPSDAWGMATHRANYALVPFQEHLGPDREALDVPWASFAGDRTEQGIFEVPTGDAQDAYVEMQVYEAGSYDHELLINGDSLTGFDVPESDGWQYWMDTVTGASLEEGKNTLQFRRDRDSGDSFVVGTVVVNWKEPAD